MSRSDQSLTFATFFRSVRSVRPAVRDLAPVVRHRVAITVNEGDLGHRLPTATIQPGTSEKILGSLIHNLIQRYVDHPMIAEGTPVLILRSDTHSCGI